MQTSLQAALCLASLLLFGGCSSTATTVETFSDPLDATQGVVAALEADNEPEAERIFRLYARSSVLRGSVFDALIRAAARAYGQGDDACGRRLVDFAQANFPNSGFGSADELEASVRAGVE